MKNKTIIAPRGLWTHMAKSAGLKTPTFKIWSEPQRWTLVLYIRPCGSPNVQRSIMFKIDVSYCIASDWKKITLDCSIIKVLFICLYLTQSVTISFSIIPLFPFLQPLSIIHYKLGKRVQSRFYWYLPKLGIFNGSFIYSFLALVHFFQNLPQAFLHIAHRITHQHFIVFSGSLLLYSSVNLPYCYTFPIKKNDEYKGLPWQWVSDRPVTLELSCNFHHTFGSLLDTAWLYLYPTTSHLPQTTKGTRKYLQLRRTI